MNNVKVVDHTINRIPPRTRETIIVYNKPATFFAPGPHYFGYRIKKLPPRPRMIVYCGRTYYYYNNVYYRPWGSYYVVSRPPFGVCIDIALREAHMASIRFAYYHNVYRTFDILDDNYRKINEQNRVIAQNNATIAAQNAAMALNSERALSSYELARQLGLVQSYANASIEYFYEDGVFYTINKKNQYEVIVPPAGALVAELPDDYEIIVLNGIEYYQVDDTVYRLTLVDGTPCLEVLGQLTGALAQQHYIYK